MNICKSLLALVLGLMISFPSFAEWKKYSENAVGDTFLLDSSTIRPHNSYKRVWRLSNFRDPLAVGGNNIYSAKNYTEIDCQEIKYREISRIFYSGTNGSGEVLISSNSPTDWDYFQPDGAVYVLYKIVCKK